MEKTIGLFLLKSGSGRLDQISVKREAKNGRLYEEYTATAAVARSGTLGRRGADLAPATGSTLSPKSLNERVVWGACQVYITGTLGKSNL
jgi:hypothetical protein